MIAWGDQLFSRDTIESINEATQIYVLAAEILGRRPEVIARNLKPPVLTFNSLAPSVGALGNAHRRRPGRTPCTRRYTLSIGQNSTHVLNGATYALQYDLLADFEPVALISTSAYLIVARKTMPANDLKGFIDCH